jgi:hypothetical protein
MKYILILTFLASGHPNSYVPDRIYQRLDDCQTSAKVYAQDLTAGHATEIKGKCQEVKL